MTGDRGFDPTPFWLIGHLIVTTSVRPPVRLRAAGWPSPPRSSVRRLPPARWATCPAAAGTAPPEVQRPTLRGRPEMPYAGRRRTAGCQGRSKIRPRWRRNTRPPGRWAECLSAVVRTGWSGVWDRPWGGLRRSGNPCAQPAPSWGGGVRAPGRPRGGGPSCCVRGGSCRR